MSSSAFESWLLLASGRAVIAFCTLVASNVSTRAQTANEWTPTVYFSVGVVDPSVQLTQLIADQKWEQAAEWIVNIRDQPSSGLFESESPLPDQRVTRTWIPVDHHVSAFAQEQLVTHPDLLTHWRKRVDRRAAGLFQAAYQQSTIHEFELLANRYFLATGGDVAMIRLGGRFAENGQLHSAIRCFCRINHRFLRFVVPSLSSHDPLFYPDSKQSAFEVATRIIVLRTMLTGDDPVEDLDWLRAEFGDSGELTDDRLARLEETLKSIGRSDPAAESSTGSANQSLQLAWSISLDKTVNDRNTDSTSVAPSTPYPLVTAQHVFWRDTRRIFAARRGSGEPAFDNGAVARDDNLDAYVVWESVNTRGRHGDSLRDGQPLTLSRDGSRIFGVVGDFDSNQIVGIDTSREGRLLPGFPIAAPDSSWRFEGPPIVDQGRLYVAARRYPKGGSRVVVAIFCYEMKITDNNLPLRRLWTRELCQADLQNDININSREQQGINRRSATRMVMDEGRLFYNGDCGVVCCIDSVDGKLRWMVTYPRTNWFSPDPYVSRLPQQRSGQPPLVSGNRVWMLPADSPCLFCLDKQSGRLVWQAWTPGSRHLLHASGETLLAGGVQLTWFDIESGEPAARFPDVHVNAYPGMRLPSNRGWGLPVATGNRVLFPSRGAIHQLGREPVEATGDPREPSIEIQSVFKRQEFARGGHLVQKEGMMIVADDHSIQAFRLIDHDDDKGPKSR